MTALWLFCGVSLLWFFYEAWRAPVIETEPLCDTTCTCCGNRFYTVPVNHQYGGDPLLEGWSWQCRCGSTLFLPRSMAL